MFEPFSGEKEKKRARARGQNIVDLISSGDMCRKICTKIIHLRKPADQSHGAQMSSHPINWDVK